jgi:hypothetical protein
MYTAEDEANAEARVNASPKQVTVSLLSQRTQFKVYNDRARDDIKLSYA